MGLDMWLYKVKYTDVDKAKEYLWNNDEEALQKFMIFLGPSKMHLERYPECFRDIFPYMVDGVHRKNKLSESLVRKKFAIPAGAFVHEIESSGIRRIQAKLPDGTVYEILASHEDYNQVCDVTIRDVCVVEKTLELYWRKEYDIQSAFYDAYPGVIENCGYHCIDEDEVKAILSLHMAEEEYKELLPQLDCSSDECFIYYEWY